MFAHLESQLELRVVADRMLVTFELRSEISMPQLYGPGYVCESHTALSARLNHDG